MKHSVKIAILLVMLFLASQFIGLIVLNKYIDVPKTQETGEISWHELPSIAGLKIERPEIKPEFSFAYIAVAIIIGTILVLLLIRFKTMFLWKLWYFLAVAISLTIAFGAFMSSILASLIGFIVAGLKTFRPSIIIHNLSELFIYAGLAAIFVPIISTFSVFVLLVLISLYDMYAVWQSKHMIKMAKFQAKSGIFAGLLIPYKFPKRIKKIPKSKLKKIRIKMALLGGGDLGFPLIFAGVIMKSVGLWKAMIIPPFVAAALLGLMFFGKKDRFYPAMPFLSIGCVVGYLAILALGYIV